MALEILDKKINYEDSHNVTFNASGGGYVQTSIDIFDFNDLDELRDWAEGVILQDSTPLKLPRKGKKEVDKEVE